jgi:hypothetical protein
MPRPVEPPRQPCDLLAVCNIADPLLHRTCIGVNKSGTSCKNVVSKVSRESASHWLEILAMRPTDEFLKSKLPTVVGLLLCKQRHQDQASQICRKWLDRLYQPDAHDTIRTSEYSLSSYPPSGRARQESRVHGLIDPMDGRTDSDVASAPWPVLQGYSPPTSGLSSVRRCSQAVTPTMVRENQIPFHVSSARLAVVSVPRADGRVGSVTLRTFRKGRQLSDVECDICRECRSDDTVYLNCEECSGEFHWICMEAWLYHGPPQAGFTCPHWYEVLNPLEMLVNKLTKANSREDCLFDGFYSTPCTPHAQAPESPVNTTAPHQPHEQSSGGAGVGRQASRPSPRSSNLEQEPESTRSGDPPRPVRRSGRVTRRPDYFIPA